MHNDVCHLLCNFPPPFNSYKEAALLRVQYSNNIFLQIEIMTNLLTKNHKCKPHCRARRKSLWFLLCGQWMSVKHAMAIHVIVRYISVMNKMLVRYCYLRRQAASILKQWGVNELSVIHELWLVLQGFKLATFLF